MGAIHSTKISGNFGPKLNGKTGSPFEVVHFSQSDRSEFWLNGLRPIILSLTSSSAPVDFSVTFSAVF